MKMLCEKKRKLHSPAGTFCICSLLHLTVINPIDIDLHSDCILLAASYLRVILQPTFSSVLIVHYTSDTFLLSTCAFVCVSLMPTGIFSVSPKLCVEVKKKQRITGVGLLKGKLFTFFSLSNSWMNKTIQLEITGQHVRSDFFYR